MTGDTVSWEAVATGSLRVAVAIQDEAGRPSSTVCVARRASQRNDVVRAGWHDG